MSICIPLSCVDEYEVGPFPIIEEAAAPAEYPA